jgi:hypothetical protein
VGFEWKSVGVNSVEYVGENSVEPVADDSIADDER